MEFLCLSPFLKMTKSRSFSWPISGEKSHGKRVERSTTGRDHMASSSTKRFSLLLTKINSKILASSRISLPLSLSLCLSISLSSLSLSLSLSHTHTHTHTHTHLLPTASCNFLEEYDVTALPGLHN